jgi:hypothetical protein
MKLLYLLICRVTSLAGWFGSDWSKGFGSPLFFCCWSFWMVCDYEASVSYNRLGVTSVSASGASIRPDGAGLRLLVQFVGSRPRGLRLPLGVHCHWK